MTTLDELLEKHRALEKYRPQTLQETFDAVLAENKSLVTELSQYKWRPIAEMHEDYGPCVVIHIVEDPCYLEIASVNDVDFDDSSWTHFAQVPKLLREDAERLIGEMGVLTNLQ